MGIDSGSTATRGRDMADLADARGRRSRHRRGHQEADARADRAGHPAGARRRSPPPGSRSTCETCVHCGLCAEACQTYLSRDGDPDYAPVAKVKDTLWEMVQRKGKVDGEFLRNAARIAFTECGACRRCSMYCPFGIDIAYLIMTVRRICNLLGVVPQYLQDTTNSHAVTMNQMWVQQDDWIDTLMWQEEDAAGRARRDPHPARQGGCRHHVLGDRSRAQDPGPADRQHGHHHQGRRRRLDHALRRRLGQQQHGDVLGRLRDHGAGRAAALGARHAAQGQAGGHGRVRPRLPRRGLRRPPVARLDASPRSPWSTRSSSTTSSSRAAGSRSPGRSRSRSPSRTRATSSAAAACTRSCATSSTRICEDFRDMDPRYEHNYCCAAGGGVINCGPPWKLSRMKSNRVKAEQIADTGAHTGDHPVPQLPQRHRGHHRLLQARMPRLVHQRAAGQDHRDARTREGGGADMTGARDGGLLRALSLAVGCLAVMAGVVDGTPVSTDTSSSFESRPIAPSVIVMDFPATLGPLDRARGGVRPRRAHQGAREPRAARPATDRATASSIRRFAATFEIVDRDAADRPPTTTPASAATGRGRTPD